MLFFRQKFVLYNSPNKPEVLVTRKRLLFIVIVLLTVGLLFKFFGFKALIGLVALAGTKAFWIAVMTWLATPIKLLLLGSLKIVGLGVAATFFPVWTVNMWENKTKDTFPDYLLKLGKITNEEYRNFTIHRQPIDRIVTEKDQYLTRKEAREWLIQKIWEIIQSFNKGLSDLLKKIQRVPSATNSEEA